MTNTQNQGDARTEGGASSDASSPAPTDEAISRHVRTKFLSRIAHDLRAPAGVASGALQELEGALGEAAGEHRMWFTMLRRSVARILRLADRLSLVAEVEEHPLELARTRTDAVALTRRAVETATFLQGRSAVTVSSELPEGEISGPLDARWLEPAVVDVVCNGIRFAHRNVRVSVSREAGRISIAVEDDGAGFSPDTLAHLFVRLAPRGPSGGLGVSMPLVHTVVNEHGGRLLIEPSRLPVGRGGKPGARVVLELPESA